MILYIIRWTVIYVLLICLLHNLYLFFQDNLTTTKNKDYYNSVLIEPNVEANVEPNVEANIEANIEKTNNSSKDLNSEFTYQMKYELNDFIRKMEK
jgi:hypothetical protein